MAAHFFLALPSSEQLVDAMGWWAGASASCLVATLYLPPRGSVLELLGADRHSGHTYPDVLDHPLNTRDGLSWPLYLDWAVPSQVTALCPQDSTTGRVGALGCF